MFVQKNCCEAANKRDKVWDQERTSKVGTNSFPWSDNLHSKVHSVAIDEEAYEPETIDE